MKYKLKRSKDNRRHLKSLCSHSLACVSYINRIQKFCPKHLLLSALFQVTYLFSEKKIIYFRNYLFTFFSEPSERFSLIYLFNF